MRSSQEMAGCCGLRPEGYGHQSLVCPGKGQTAVAGMCTATIARTTPTTSKFGMPGLPRLFRRRCDIARHKCHLERQLPKHLQSGAAQCQRCLRWFLSQGGLAVHKCALDFTAPPSVPMPSSSQQPSHTCRAAHCGSCGRCFRSISGFRRHNCERGKRVSAETRALYEDVCDKCGRRFRRSQDLKRHTPFCARASVPPLS